MGSSWRFLRISAVVEAVTLIVLVTNLATVHWSAISSSVGPVHGCAYLFVIIATVGEHQATRPMKLIAGLPGIGGLFVLRQLAARRDQGHAEIPARGE